MKAGLPAVCILCGILSTASSLKCKTCGAILQFDDDANYWNGKVERERLDCPNHKEVECLSEDEVCASAYEFTLNHEGKLTMYVKMECMAPQHCNESGSVTIPGFKVSYSITCCSDGDMCTPEKPVLEYTTYGSGCASKDVCPEDRSLHFLKNPYVSTHTYVCSKVSSNTDLKPGHFLRCYICSNNNVENCKDMPSLCSLDEDVCLFEKIRNIYNGKDETEITRRCGKSTECSRAGTITSSTKAILMNTTCCNQTLCHPPVPALPSASHEDNGVICSACFVPNSDRCIGRNNLKCTGEENRCIHYMRTEKKSVLTVTESLYGCATEGICKAGSSKSIPRANYFKTVTTDIVCNSATTWTSKARLVFFFFMTKLICRQYLFEEYNV